MILLRAERTVTSAFWGIFALVVGRGGLDGGGRGNLGMKMGCFLGKADKNVGICLGKVAILAYNRLGKIAVGGILRI